MLLRVFLILLLIPMHSWANPVAQRGKALYMKQCAECHGDKGEGVEDEYDEPLYGDRTVVDLAKVIHDTMPDYAPEECADEDAQAVAAYIHEAFYSAEARARNRPVRIDLVRLTAAQHAQSVADLVASFRWQPKAEAARGLQARYYDDRRTRRDKMKLERVDPTIDFDFGEASPLPGEIGEEAFAIEWTGSLMVEETGDYQFSVRTENGFKLYLNSDTDTPLIDGWVSSGEMVEPKATVKLLGGWAYPVRLEYFKFKDKSASVELRWKPPHGVNEIIPTTTLRPTAAPPVMVLQTPFPPDDRSLGYVRGSAVSKAWGRAVTSAALETADHVARHLRDLADLPRRRSEAPENETEKIQAFCETLVRRAFRRPLTEEDREHFVRQHFCEDTPHDVAVKRVVLLALQSPQFLFPELSPAADSWKLVSRLSTYLYDGLPDAQLRDAGKKGWLGSADAVRKEAARLLDHPTARAKVRTFFLHWLHLDDEHDLTKDHQLFPGFDASTIADFRQSLTLFIDDVVWSERSDYQELLLGNDLFLNADLANFLGHGTMTGDTFRKVSFDPKARSGVLTHPYLLARFAYHQSTSPIHRGVFMARQVLGRSLKPPPEAIEFDDAHFDPSLTMRQKVTDLTKSRACMNCHSIINPLGFSLEHFDATGRYRFRDRHAPIDPVSEFGTQDGRSLTIRGPRDVAVHAAHSPTAHRGFIQHLFEHLVKQPVNAYGMNTLDTLHQDFVASQFNIRALIVEIATLAAMHDSPSNQATSTDHEPKNL